MRVLIDARPAAFAQPTGIGTYTRALLSELPKADLDTDFVVWYLRGRDLLRRGPKPSLRDARVRRRWTPFPSRWFEIASERWALPRIEWLARFDVLFAPNFVPPPTRSRHLVITVHDLAFRRFPETAPHGTRRWLARLDAAIQQAARIIVPSRCTGDDLRELFGVDRERVAVVPHGVDHGRFNPEARSRATEVAGGYGLRGPYLLALGGIEPRKNLPALLQAYASLPDDVRPELAIVGSGVEWNPEGPSALRAALATLPPAVRDGIVLTGYVPDHDVPAIVAGALALAYPSRYEGFGLPVLEAMACGTPVLSSSVSAIPEVTGDAALLVDPTAVDTIADGLRRIVEDEGLRKRLSATGVDRARAFTWPEAARRTAAVLRDAGAA
jgi:glycosyltransferase involved in cell wall biosynthesis